jgi:hypothetical protein
MLRFFGIGFDTENETEITTKFQCRGHYNDNSGEYATEFESRPCSAEDGFELEHRIISKKIAIVEKHCKEIFINISLEGKLNGKELNKQFHDLVSYHQFLQYSLLINTSTINPDFVKAIKLLQQAGIIDNEKNRNYNNVIQTMIKKSLLTLPNICSELAFLFDNFNDHYNPSKRPIHQNYLDEVMSILELEIPSLLGLRKKVGMTFVTSSTSTPEQQAEQHDNHADLNTAYRK